MKANHSLSRTVILVLLAASLAASGAVKSPAQSTPIIMPGAQPQVLYPLPPQRERPLASEEVVAKVAPSVVVILAGSGSVPVALGSGVIVRPDGIIMTAYHLIKDQPAVQVRLKNGETYDRAVILGFDQRRDVVALRIPAGNLPTLARAPLEDTRQGATVYTISNPAGLEWTASSGILSATRQADDVPGAGAGYRLLQFTASVTHGSSGGALADNQGRLLGIVVGSMGGQNLNFAVPLESVMGLADRVDGLALGSGQNLTFRRRGLSSNDTERTEKPRSPAEIMRSAHTVCLLGNPMFPAEPLEKKLFERPEFKSGNLVIVEDPHVADLVIELSRKEFTWDFTYRLVHPASGVILGAGKVIAWDGVRAAPELAKQIMDRIRFLRGDDDKGSGKSGEQEPATEKKAS
ncbi:MAG TPA: S1C family serine protease [Terriglobia bacterium]|nr:S1C family serine protease [Terriglobia bacterium]